ncbi:MAG: hypothetical protein GF328_00850 [Candidatus Latescibacteria bacterium]|nr:hypothetical protein [Candidatus Latescibacterota bacterium]
MPLAVVPMTCTVCLPAAPVLDTHCAVVQWPAFTQCGSEIAGTCLELSQFLGSVPLHVVAFRKVDFSVDKPGVRVYATCGRKGGHPDMRPTTPEQLSFADLERRGSAGTDRLLDTISDLLDGVPEATELVRRDLDAGLTKPTTGRRGLGPETVLRSLILCRIKDYPYRELGDRVADGYELRRFVRLRGRPVPKHNAFQRAFNRLSADTLKEIIDLFARAAKEEGLDDGREVRIDGSVVETDIHFPTDASLLWDVVRVLTRLVQRLGEGLPLLLEGFHDRTRRSKKLFFRIQRPSRKAARAKTDTMYRELIGLASEVVDAAALVADRAEAVVSADVLDRARTEALRQDIGQYVELGKKVIDQARRRIVEGEKVPAKEKIVSIFEPHTDIIVCNKKRKPVEFGHKLVIAETKAGFIFHHDVQDGNPSEQPWVEETLSRHDEGSVKK